MITLKWKGMKAVFVYFQVMVEHLSLGSNKNQKKYQW